MSIRTNHIKQSIKSMKWAKIPKATRKEMIKQIIKAMDEQGIK